MEKFAVANALAPQQAGGGRSMVCPGWKMSEPARESPRQPLWRSVAKRIVEVPGGPPSRDLVLCQSQLETPTFEEAGDAGHVRTALLAGHRPVGKVAAGGRSHEGVQAPRGRCLAHRWLQMHGLTDVKSMVNITFSKAVFTFWSPRRGDLEGMR